MVLHKVKTGKTGRCKAVLCSFYVLFLLKKLQLQLQAASPPDPHLGRCPLDPHWGTLLRPPGPHFSADFSILNSHACICLMVHVFCKCARLFQLWHMHACLALYPSIWTSSSWETTLPSFKVSCSLPVWLGFCLADLLAGQLCWLATVVSWMV